MTNSTLENKLTLLKQYLTDADDVARWHSFITESTDAQLYRINAFRLAAHWKLDKRDVLTEFIHATRIGLMILDWDLVCPMCHTANTHEHLNSVCSTQMCRGCGNSFDVSFDYTIKVTFSIHTSIRELSPDLLQSAQDGDDDTFVTGLDCATLPAFREFFASDVLSSNESLQVRDVSILFTDIKGSTMLYERLGDARAYQAVRAHFDVLFAAIAQNKGAVIKTIGDAIMASFVRPSDAVRAGVEAQKSFTTFRPLLPASDEAIIVKMGIHHGACIAVTLNDRLDFFGGTVNIAARAQQQAKGWEMTVTEAVYDDADVSEVLKSSELKVLPFQTMLRGLSGEFRLYRIVHPLGASDSNDGDNKSDSNAGFWNAAFGSFLKKKTKT